MPATIFPKPVVLFVSLETHPSFDEMYAGLIDKISNVASIKRAQKAQPAIRQLNNKPWAVLITDAAIAFPENAPVYDAILSYVRQGGTAVIMGHFSTFIPLNEMRPFFAKAGLDWDCSAYTRETHSVNPRAVGPLQHSLPQTYLQKALHLKNVQNQAAWYLQKQYEDEDSQVEPSAFAPITNLTDTPAAYEKVGNGWYGYLGDVNSGKECELVVMAMCRLPVS